MGQQQTGLQTQTTRPPDFAIPYVGAGLVNSMGMLQEGGPQQYQGATVTPFSQPTQQAMSMQMNRAMQGSPLVDQAQNTVGNIAAGNSPLASMAQGGSNPYLDATFNKAAGAVNRSMDTVLARSGRDLTGNLAARSDQLNNLATNIYGGAYESDANRRLSAAQGLGSQQLQAAGMAPQLAREDYFDIGQLGKVGSQLEDLTSRYQQDAMRRFNYEQQRPEAALDAYLARTQGGNYGNSTSSPIYRNPFGDALGGAAAGASLGSAFGPWGTGIGAVAGGLLGYGG